MYYLEAKLLLNSELVGGGHSVSFHICTNPINCRARVQACFQMLPKHEPTSVESIGYNTQIGVILDG